MKLPAVFLLCTLIPPAAQAAQAPKVVRPPKAAEPGPSLPAAAALTNLRSLSGRAVYLLVRPKGDLDVAARAQQIAAPIGATSRAHALGSLWVVALQHPKSALVVRRLGPELRVDLASNPAPLLDPQVAAVVRLPPDRPEEDYDQEIMLRAMQSFREGDHVPPMMVSLAQGAASRLLLRHIADGDEVLAALWGRRHTPLLSAHPDSRLLLELVSEASKALEVPLPDDGEPAASPTPEAVEFERFEKDVRATVEQARQRLAREGKDAPDKDKDKDKEKEKDKEKTHE